MPASVYDTSQSIRLVALQSPALCQRQRQYLSLLAMDRGALDASLDTLLLENPVLLREEPVRKGAGRAPYEDAWRPQDAAQSLSETLLEQLGALRLPSAQVRRLRYLIQDLNANGYLTRSAADYATAFGSSEEALLADLRILQSFEPAGIGARSLSECLCLQLERKGGRPSLAYTIAASFLDYLADGRLAQLAQMLGATEAQVKHAFKTIRALNPKPGNGFGECCDTDYIAPELSVYRGGRGLRVRLEAETRVSLSIDPQYASLLNEVDDAETQAYLRQKLREGRDMIGALALREKTLLLLGELIAERQRAFFLPGPGERKPLTMTEAALRMGVHVSTVSRAAKDKYLRCEHGVFPLSYFFVRAASEGRSAEAIQLRIRALINEEAESGPLSDGAIAERLCAMGIHISRRTAAKYRAQLHIPAASNRKRAKAAGTDRL